MHASDKAAMRIGRSSVDYKNITKLSRTTHSAAADTSYKNLVIQYTIVKDQMRNYFKFNQRRFSFCKRNITEKEKEKFETFFNASKFIYSADYETGPKTDRALNKSNSEMFSFKPPTDKTRTA